MFVLSPRKEVTSIFQITGIEKFTPILVVPGDVRVPLSSAGLYKLFAAWREPVAPTS
ncbi:hypothetical protein N787_03195 [Arenimonas metalli CF5-1]|uniref:Uncharacterized protein n=2 Tax=Arenimonas TaxID=490567 RepID=A0A091B0P5_9GAMM|nr:hypothetical protein N787_03195 [Arenimonas metalli CF5-1]